MEFRSNPLRVLAWMGLVLFSVWPVARVEALFAAAAAPLRLLSAATPPVHWLRRREVHAAEQRIAGQAVGEAEAGDALRRALARFAEPSRPELLEGRRAVRGEVLRRDAGALDRLWIQLAAGAERVDVGCPVVCGDSYVGRIGQVDGVTGRARVDLITGRDVFVGARLVPDVREGAVDEAQLDATVRMTVGGVARAPGVPRALGWQRVWLDVHNPSERSLGLGQVVVDELAADELDALGLLAEGYSLGRLGPPPVGALSPQPMLEPDLDYAHGLFQVIVLTLEDGGPVRAEPAGMALEDGRWLAVRSLGGGEPSPWRHSLKISRGSESGVAVGAAVVSGARLLGRVVRAGWGFADVALLGDPGLDLVAVAQLAEIEEPQMLGRLIGVGREVSAGAASPVIFECSPRETVERAVLDAGGVAGVEVFTGAGERGLPSGLWIGTGELSVPGARVGDPVGGERHRVRLDPAVGGHDVRELWVRIDAGSEQERGEGAR